LIPGGFLLMKKMTESQELLADYAENGSESAFRDLVARYVDLVHSAALRLVGGDREIAEDVTQVVFLQLARNADKLARDSFLGGWLHRNTCFEASKTMRGEQRRRAREKQAAFMNSLTDHSAANLEKIGPVLDEAINLLGIDDRTAIVLRFFEQRDFRAVGAALGSNEDAARMRVNRALDKLHILLLRRGVTMSAIALGTALTVQAVSAAPAGLATAISGNVLAASAAGSGISATLLKIMTITKLKVTIAGAVVVAGITTSLIVQTHANAHQRDQEATLQQQSQELAGLAAENARLSALLTQTKDDSSVNDTKDLAMLRTEAARLRKQTSGLAALREENRKLKAQKAAQPSKARTDLEMKEQNLERINYSRQWQLGFIMYANDHNGNYPTNFGQLFADNPNVTKGSENVTFDDFEVVFQGAQDSIRSPASIIMLREKEARQAPDGKWQKVYGFADGHAEIHSEPTANFDAYEKDRIIARPAQ
jgi:RNA polymerase sigma factor (sigma-70 family)